MICEWHGTWALYRSSLFGKLFGAGAGHAVGPADGVAVGLFVEEDAECASSGGIFEDSADRLVGVDGFGFDFNFAGSHCGSSFRSACICPSVRPLASFQLEYGIGERAITQKVARDGDEKG